MNEPRDAAEVGDRIEVGDVTNSEAVAVGRGARAFKAGRDLFVGVGAAARREVQRERENRRRMLARVRKTWIEGVLDSSLHGEALLALGLETRPDAVPDRWGLVVQEAQEAPRRLPPETPIAEVFDAFGGELLILGAPGAGKTTLLLELARTLLDRAAEDEALPMPVVFPLSTWVVRRPPLAEWLVRELSERYDVPHAVAASWVADERILPLLDGLDEVQAEHRAACVTAINAFHESRRAGLASLAVCCRTADYQALDTRLQLPGAVLIQPLTPQQADAYVAGGGTQLAALRAALRHDAVLMELAASPLLLSLMTLTYRDAPAAALPTGELADDRRTELFGAYVDRMFVRRGAAPRYTREQTVRWLAWLAAALTRHAQPVFYLERLQPDWLPTAATRVRYALVDRLGGALCVGLLFALVGALVGALPVAPPAGVPAEPAGGRPEGGLLFGLLAAAIVGLFGETGERRPGARLRFWGVVRKGILGWLSIGLVAGAVTGLAAGVTGSQSNKELELALVSSGVPGELAASMTGGLSGGLIFGLAFGLIFGLAGGLAGGLTGGPDVRPRPITVVETLRWSFARAMLSAVGGAVAGLLIGAAVALLIGVVFGTVASLLFPTPAGALLWGAIGLLAGLFLGILGGVHFGLLFGVVGGLVSGELPERTAPNQGIRRSARTAVLIGLGTGLLYTLALSVSLGLMVGGVAEPDGEPIVWQLPDLMSLLLGAVPGGLLYALIGGLPYGGYSCLSHLALRLGLWRTGVLPLRAVTFLDYAAERILLRKVGGGYIFVHRLLQEHFAALEGGRSPVGPSTQAAVPATSRNAV